MSPKHAGSKWNGDQAAAQRLAMAKKAALANQPKRESWWATPGLSREDFRKRVDQRHMEIMNSASEGTRSLGKAI